MLSQLDRNMNEVDVVPARTDHRRNRSILRFLRWPSDIFSPEGSFPFLQFKGQHFAFWIMAAFTFVGLMGLFTVMVPLTGQPRWLVFPVAGITLGIPAALVTGLWRERSPSGASDGAWKASLLAVLVSMVEPLGHVGQWAAKWATG
jgi:hypothetical protein